MGEQRAMDRPTLEEYFAEVDEDCDGMITIEELLLVAQRAGANPTIEEIREKYIDNMDKDGDSCITCDEFCNFMGDCPDGNREMIEAFKFYDTNQDGRIDANELKDILCQCDDITEEEVEADLADFDKDGDGKLNIGEFVQMMNAKQDYQHE